MTFGSGSNGCLGHGNFNDVTQVAHITQQYTVHNVGSSLETSPVQCNAAIILRGVSTVLFTYFILMRINGNYNSEFKVSGYQNYKLKPSFYK